MKTLTEEHYEDSMNSILQ